VPSAAGSLGGELVRKRERGSAVSGEVPSDPVVSRKTGHVYERRLLEKHLEMTGSCPVTGEPMTMDDVIAIQTPKHVVPRTPAATSVSGLMGALQKEWDSLMLSSSELRRALHRTRAQLSQMMYQYDASCRVIARLVRERDDARARLRDAQRSGGVATVSAAVSSSSSSSSSVEHGEEEVVVDQGVVDRLQAANDALRAERVSRKSSKASVAPVEAVSALASNGPSKSVMPHASDRPTIQCMAMHPNRPSLVVTGGADKNIVLFDKEASAIAATLSGHSKAVSGVAFLPADPDRVILSMARERAKAVCVWTPSASAVEAVEGADVPTSFEPVGWNPHGDADVLALSPHPREGVVLSVGSDGRWVVTDLNAPGGPRVALTRSTGAGGALSTGAFHVDGVLVATARGDSGVVTLWDVRQQAPVSEIPSTCAGIASLCMSENGYQLAVGGTGGRAAIVDLRQKDAPMSFEPGGAAGLAVRAVALDASGKYLAAGASSVHLMSVKKWKPLGELTGPGEGISGIAWGPDASFIVCAADKHLRWHG
jgi:pre-mRNA-processing factor 19